MNAVLMINAYLQNLGRDPKNVNHGYTVEYNPIKGYYQIDTPDNQFLVVLGDEGFEIRFYDSEEIISLTKLSELRSYIECGAIVSYDFSPFQY